jgi:hypothetical protein
MGKSKILVPVFLGFAAFAVVLIWLTQRNVTPKPKVTSFEECAKAGYPVMESYPRQCTVAGGKTFVEEYNPEIPAPR